MICMMEAMLDEPLMYSSQSIGDVGTRIKMKQFQFSNCQE